MRILDEISDKSLDKVAIYLTHDEALELRDSLIDLLEKSLNNHAHIPSENLQKEITVCVYDFDNLNGFNERSVSLIKNDE